MRVILPYENLIVNRLQLFLNNLHVLVWESELFISENMLMSGFILKRPGSISRFSALNWILKARKNEHTCNSVEKSTKSACAIKCKHSTKRWRSGMFIKGGAADTMITLCLLSFSVSAGNVTGCLSRNYLLGEFVQLFVQQILNIVLTNWIIPFV